MRTQLAADITIWAAFALLLWLPLGRRLMRRLGFARAEAGLAVPVALGMGAWGLWILLLGVAGLLQRWLVLGSAAAIFLGLRLHRHFPAAGPRPQIPFSSRTVLASLLWTLAALHMTIVFGSALAPETSFDALNVHLPYSRDAAGAGRIAFAPNNWSSSMPALPLMSYITAFLFSGATLAKLFNFLCYLACGGVVFRFASRWWGFTHGSAAALLFWSSPVALYEGTTALIDLPLALYSAVAVFSLLEWVRSGRRPFFLLSGASLGLALGCKYHAVFWLPAAAILILFRTLGRERRGLGAAVRLLAGYGLIGFVLFLPWMWRAWSYTGNPVFPAANGLFQSPYFPPSMVEAASAVYEREGIARTPLEFLALPLKVSFSPGPFNGTPGWIFLPALVLALVRPKDSVVRAALVPLACYFCAWAFTAQEIRYLLPLVPLLAVLAAKGLLPAVERAEGEGIWGRAARIAGAAAIVAGAVLSFPPLYARSVTQWTYWHGWQSPARYLAGRQTAQEYLLRDVPSIHVYGYINAHLAPNDRVLLLNDSAQFYSRVPTLYSFTVEGEKLLHQESEAGVLGALRASRITHVLLNYHGMAPLPGVAERRGVYIFLDEGFRERNLEPVFSSNRVVLYRVRG